MKKIQKVLNPLQFKLFLKELKISEKSKKKTGQKIFFLHLSFIYSPTSPEQQKRGKLFNRNGKSKVFILGSIQVFQ